MALENLFKPKYHEYIDQLNGVRPSTRIRILAGGQWNNLGSFYADYISHEKRGVTVRHNSLGQIYVRYRDIHSLTT